MFRLGAIALCAGICIACSEVPPQVSAAPESSAAPAVTQSGSDAASSRDARLDQLRQSRASDTFSSKLGIGPGDVIEVTVAGVPELKEYKVRVSEDATIAVPLAGVVRVGGLSEEEIRQALYKELSKPIKDPQVEVFVEKYHSREVAVVGMVSKPGLYTIDGHADTVLKMIGRAGGLNSQASSRVLFIPASTQAQDVAKLTNGLAASAESSAARVEPVSTQSTRPVREEAAKADRVEAEPAPTDPPGAVSGQNRLLSMIGQVDPIEIDLTRAAREGQLNVPVRPGDTIIVPAAGEVMVDGWVANPGAFRIVPGMTALGAVTAAGGAIFSQTANVLRTNADGSRRAIVVDLSKVKSGEEEDVPVVAGDVVFVRRSALGAVPYAFYEIFTKFGTGMYLPAP